MTMARRVLFGTLGTLGVAAGGVGMALYSGQLRQPQSDQARRQALASVRSSAVTLLVGAGFLASGWDAKWGRRLAPLTVALVVGEHLLRDPARK